MPVAVLRWSRPRFVHWRSTSAAAEIKALIATSSQTVDSGTELVGEAGKVLQTIATEITDIDALISKIATSAAEQSSGLSEVNTAIAQMDRFTQQNAAMVQQAAAATHSLRSETSELSRLIAGFRLGDAAPQGAGRSVSGGRGSPDPRGSPDLSSGNRPARAREAVRLA
jgi:methyl-accepting chemotaxis protein